MSAERALRAVESEPDKGTTPAPTAAAALGFSLQVDFGVGRVGTIQTFLPNDCSFRDLNLMLDKMMLASDRQRAHYQIEGLERDLKKFEQEQVQGLTDLEKIESDFGAAQRARQAEVERQSKVLVNFLDARKANAEERGVRESTRLKSTDKANADKIETTIATLRAEIAVAPESHAETLREAKKVIDKRADLIAKTQAEIDRNREIVAAGLKD